MLQQSRNYLPYFTSITACTLTLSSTLISPTLADPPQWYPTIGIETTEYRGSIYFSVFNPDTATFGLWKTDGTKVGTVLIKDSLTNAPQNFIRFRGLLYFDGCTAATGCEVWRSNGTPESTKLFKDIEPGAQSAAFKSLVRTREKLYFQACNTANGCEVWTTDGTSQGTSLLKDIIPGASGSIGYATPAFAVGNRVVFEVCQTFDNCQLWSTDGTKDGTSLLKDIDVTYLGNGSVGTLWRDEFYFRGCSETNNANACQLWKTDGTPKGTVLVKDVALTGARGGVIVIESITPYANQLFFSANNSINGSELWKTDGTTAGTVQVRDINPGAPSSFPGEFNVVKGKLCFTAQNPNFGDELWRTNGTERSTFLVKDINPGTVGSFPTVIAKFGDFIYFSAISATRKLWRSDCTESGTSLVADVEPDLPSEPGDKTAVAINNYLYFVGRTPAVRVGIWRTDGTATNIAASGFQSALGFGNGSKIENLSQVGGNLVFKVGYINPFGVYSYELWRSNGTPAGTFKIAPN